jgi:hypothetical protein
MMLQVVRLKFVEFQKFQWKDKIMGDYPPQYYSPRARKYYRKRPSVAGGGGGGASVGSWKELGRTTLGSSSSTINVSGLAEKRYLMVLHNVVGKNTVTVDDGVRVGNNSYDSSNSYSIRRSGNGTADVTQTSQSYANLYSSSANESFDVSFVANYSSKEKLGITHRFHGGGGSGNSGIRREEVWKWSNTSNAINQWQYWSGGSDTFNSGCEVVVLGYDPADTHTTTDNFWQELASVELSSAGDQISSGTIQAKKYLWIQYYIKADTVSDVTGLLRFNNDNSVNYATRYSLNGGADSARINRTYIDSTSGGNFPVFVNAFIVNNASNEKLVIGHGVWQGTQGAAPAPQRWEFVGKWTNTSNQITEIDVEQLDAGDLASGSILKVWGAD